MRFVTKFLAILAIVFASSCAMIFNDKLDKITIESNPSGADIIIEGRNYGKTPRTLNIIPKEYDITVKKAGYGSAQITTSYWASTKNAHCVSDSTVAFLILPLYSFQWSGYCNQFKKRSHFVVIPRTEAPRVESSKGHYYDNRSRGYNSNNYQNY